MAKMKRPKTHSEMQQSVCVNCLAPGCNRTVTDIMVPKIREFVVGDYDKELESVPHGICNRCRMLLYHEKKLDCHIDYNSLRKRGVFRCFHGQENHCQCYICVAGRDTQFSQFRQPKPKGPPPPVKFPTCSTCFARLAPGQPHDCRVGARVDNVLAWLPPDVAEQVTSRIVTNAAGDSSSATLKRPKGPQLTVHLGELPEKPRQLTHQDMLNFKVKYGVSNQDTKDFAHDYRTLHGRDSVQSFVGDYLAQITDTEAEYLTLTKIKINSGGELIEKVCVIVKDLQDVIDHVKAARNIGEEICLVKILGDTGGSFFKMCLATINLDRVRELLAQAKARSTYADGPFLVDDNDNGINALFIIALVPKCKEDYLLVSQVIRLLKLENLREKRWVSGGDQKYINLICGVGEHSSLFPCSWCSCHRSGFRSRLAYTRRTFGSLRSSNAAREAAGPNADPKFFLSTKYAPTLPCKDEEEVISRVIVPELHLLLRAFNHIWDRLSAAWKVVEDTAMDKAAQFAISVNAVASNYQGHDFKGNECRRLLKSLDKLSQRAPPELAPYIRCLSGLNKVVEDCFTVAGPGPHYLDTLEAFYESCVALDDLSFTPTLHAIVAHVADHFQVFGTEFGLGLYGEQAGESVHFDFESRIYTAAYKRPECHPEFGPLLLRAVAAYNAIHLNSRPSGGATSAD